MFMAASVILQQTSAALAFQSSEMFLMFRNIAVMWPCMMCMRLHHNSFHFDADSLMELYAYT